MDSAEDDPCGPGCPIRRSPDQSLLATPRSFSQPATSFFASRRQGIRQTPFSCLISRNSHEVRPCAGTDASTPGSPGQARGWPAASAFRPAQMRPPCKDQKAPRRPARDRNPRPEAEAPEPLPPANQHRVHASPPCQGTAGRSRRRSATPQARKTVSLISAHRPPADRLPEQPPQQNSRPRYAAARCAWPTAGPVELNGFEPMTSCLQSRRSPS